MSKPLPHTPAGIGDIVQPTVALYRDYFTTTDSFNRDYAASLEQYTVPVNNVNITVSAKVQQTTCDARQHRIPTAFILLGHRDNRLHV